MCKLETKKNYAVAILFEFFKLKATKNWDGRFQKIRFNRICQLRLRQFFNRLDRYAFLYQTIRYKIRV